LHNFFSCVQKHKSKEDTILKISQKAGDINISVKYSQPSVNGRVIGENLEPAGEKSG